MGSPLFLKSLLIFSLSLFVFHEAFTTEEMISPSYLYLSQNLSKAKKGDFVITVQGKVITALIVREKKADGLSLEEITLPKNKIPQHSWAEWIRQGAPGHINWILYDLDLPSGQINHTYSFTRNEWIRTPIAQNLLTTLLNLPLQKVSLEHRKKIGAKPKGGRKDQRSLWQPRMVIEGEWIEDVVFDAWKARWPNDGSELAGKNVEVYLPTDQRRFPSYFPYWIQISGVAGKAHVRVIDSGNLIAE